MFQVKTSWCQPHVTKVAEVRSSLNIGAYLSEAPGGCSSFSANLWGKILYDSRKMNGSTQSHWRLTLPDMSDPVSTMNSTERHGRSVLGTRI
jgi:hypothetical protein